MWAETVTYLVAIVQEIYIVFTSVKAIPAATAAAPTATASITQTIATCSGRNKNTV